MVEWGEGVGGVEGWGGGWGGVGWGGYSEDSRQTRAGKMRK